MTGDLLFETRRDATVACDAAVLALGGASWPKLGSIGDWIDRVATAGVAVAPLAAANCGFTVGWSEFFRALRRPAAQANCAVVRRPQRARRSDDHARGHRRRRDLRPVVAIARCHRAVWRSDVLIDLLPDLSHEELISRLATPRGKQSLSTFLRKIARLSPPAIGLLHEEQQTSGRQPCRRCTRRNSSRAVPVRLTGIAPIARAISTAGGISFDEIDEHFMLRKRPGVFIAGEMLDFDAPTGGYLLQAALRRLAGRGAPRRGASASR